MNKLMAVVALGLLVAGCDEKKIGKTINQCAVRDYFEHCASKIEPNVADFSTRIEFCREGALTMSLRSYKDIPDQCRSK